MKTSLEGYRLYRGLEYSIIVGPILVDAGLHKRFVGFRPDGRVFSDPAIEGLEVHDPEVDAVHGRYRVSKGTLEIAWSTGEKVTSPVADDGKIVLYDIRYQPLPSCDGLRLSGTYGGDWSNPYVEHRIIRFSPDGRFQDTGILPQTAILVSARYLAAPPSWSQENPPTGPGKYRMGHNTLYLDYDSGVRESIVIYVEPEDAGKQPVPSLSLGGFVFERKGP